MNLSIGFLSQAPKQSSFLLPSSFPKDRKAPSPVDLGRIAAFHSTSFLLESDHPCLDLLSSFTNTGSCKVHEACKEIPAQDDGRRRCSTSKQHRGESKVDVDHLESLHLEALVQP